MITKLLITIGIIVVIMLITVVLINTIDYFLERRKTLNSDWDAQGITIVILIIVLGISLSYTYITTYM